MSDEGPYRTNAAPKPRKRWTIVDARGLSSWSVGLVWSWVMWSACAVLDGFTPSVRRALIASVVWTLIYALAFVRRVER